MFKSSSSGRIPLLKQDYENLEINEESKFAKNFNKTQALLSVPKVKIETKAQARQSQNIEIRKSKILASGKSSGKQSLSHSRSQSFILPPPPPRESL